MLQARLKKQVPPCMKKKSIARIGGWEQNMLHVKDLPHPQITHASIRSRKKFCIYNFPYLSYLIYKIKNQLNKNIFFLSLPILVLGSK